MCCIQCSVVVLFIGSGRRVPKSHSSCVVVVVVVVVISSLRVQKSLRLS